ncbi:hypothetical protein BKA82DRAFT_4124259 [Pisolithus tinctorius]|nr:hypothetical protein BKA82DRAFT_4124259 [Pisolithus tinctorius]
MDHCRLSPCTSKVFMIIALATSCRMVHGRKLVLTEESVLTDIAHSCGCPRCELHHAHQEFYSLEQDFSSRKES